MIFGFIKNHEKKYPIEKMCKVLEVSQSGYYNWKSTIISKRRLKMMQLKEQIAVNIIDYYKAERSVSRKANCWDNAVAENFFKSLKIELIYGNKLISKEQMELTIFEKIEIWYTKKRRHPALNYMIIQEFNNKTKIYENVA
jgi:transposase InsO family protein